jgi:hypothetical protein
MAQALVQLNAPFDIRGRVVGSTTRPDSGCAPSAASPSGYQTPRSAFTGLSAAVLLALLGLLYGRAAKKSAG